MHAVWGVGEVQGHDRSRGSGTGKEAVKQNVPYSIPPPQWRWEPNPTEILGCIIKHVFQSFLTQEATEPVSLSSNF